MKIWEAQHVSNDADAEIQTPCSLYRAEWAASENCTCICHCLEAEFFATYSKWLYSGKICVDDAAESCPTYKSLFEAWAFGRIMKDTKYRIAILLATLKKRDLIRSIINEKGIEALYARTTSECSLRKLVINIYATVVSKTWFERRDGFRVQSLKDLVVAMMAFRRSRKVPNLDALRTLCVETETGRTQ